MNCSTPGLPVHHQLLDFTQLLCIESVMPSSHLTLCRPLLLLPPIPPSIRVFSNESALHIRWPKYWSFSFNMSLSSEHPTLISFRMDWLDLLAVQGTLKSLQHHSSKASILRHSAFFTIQLSHPYVTTGKTIDLTRQTFVGKVMSLLLNMLPAATKSLQSCLTLCNPIDGSPPGSPIPGQEHWSGLPFPSPMHESEKSKWSHSVVSNSSRLHGLQPTRLLRPWDIPGKSTGVGFTYLFQFWFPQCVWPAVGLLGCMAALFPVF